jgi:GNAT superfamily N-acetyltransferase
MMNRRKPATLGTVITSAGCGITEIGTMEPAIDIVGYYPGVIGQITTLHAVYYHRYWGLDHSFEAQEARELAEFISHFDKEKDGLWNAVSGGTLVGCIAISKDQDETGDARLRWYIVDPPWQGKGIGRALISNAIDFSRKAGYKRICLWTFKGLDQARSMYEKHGFRMTVVRDVPQWGRMVREQRFELGLRD